MENVYVMMVIIFLMDNASNVLRIPTIMDMDAHASQVLLRKILVNVLLQLCSNANLMKSIVIGQDVVFVRRVIKGSKENASRSFSVERISIGMGLAVFARQVISLSLVNVFM